MLYFKNSWYQYINCLLIAIAVMGSLRASDSVLEAVMDKTLDTWATVDIIRAIACEDRHHLYARLVKANLDLYATIYLITQTAEQKKGFSQQYLEAIEQVFSALRSAQNDAVTCGTSSEPSAVNANSMEGLCSCLILDQTKLQWDQFCSRVTNFLRP